MERKDKKQLFEIIEGAITANPDTFQAFEKEMAENVIPSIVEAIENRRVFASETRLWQLKC